MVVNGLIFYWLVLTYACKKVSNKQVGPLTESLGLRHKGWAYHIDVWPVIERPGSLRETPRPLAERPQTAVPVFQRFEIACLVV